MRGAHGPVARCLGKICQGCASRAHQGCGSLPEPSSFVIATVNQRLKTESDPKGRAQETGLVGKKRGASGERSLPEVGRSAAQKLRMRTAATARGISAGSGLWSLPQVKRAAAGLRVSPLRQSGTGKVSPPRMDGSARAGALLFQAGRFICQSTRTTAGVWTTQAQFPYSQPTSPCGLGSLGPSPR